MGLQSWTTFIGRSGAGYKPNHTFDASYFQAFTTTFSHFSKFPNGAVISGLLKRYKQHYLKIPEAGLRRLVQTLSE